MASTDEKSTAPAESWATAVAQLQAELAGFKAETAVKVAALEETITGLAHENTLLKRRLYGNKTERSRTSELQLALGDLLVAEAQLQKDLDKKVDAATAGAPPEPNGGGTPRPHGRRNLLASKLPRVVIEIIHEELEARGCRRVGFEESPQLAFRPGGFYVLVKRVAKYEVVTNGIASVETTPSPETLFPRAMLHTSTIAHLLTSKFAMGTPHYRLEQALGDQGVPLDRGLMCRYVEEAGNTLGATIVAAMWRDAIAHGQVISTDATGALIQPTKAKDGRSLACKKGHFFTAVVDAHAVLFHYAEKHTSDMVQQLFGEFRGFLQADASAVYDILERGPPKDDPDAGVKLVGCWAHYPERVVIPRWLPATDAACDGSHKISEATIGGTRASIRRASHSDADTARRSREGGDRYLARWRSQVVDDRSVPRLGSPMACSLLRSRHRRAASPHAQGHCDIHVDADRSPQTSSCGAGLQGRRSQWSARVVVRVAEAGRSRAELAAISAGTKPASVTRGVCRAPSSTPGRRAGDGPSRCERRERISRKPAGATSLDLHDTHRRHRRVRRQHAHPPRVSDGRGPL